MASDKFDFVVATALIQSVEAAASALEVENQSLEQRFGKLREGFKDSAYDAYLADMSAASMAIANVISQMRVVSKHIIAYSEKMRMLEANMSDE